MSVWRTSGGTTAAVGAPATIPAAAWAASFAGNKAIGMQLAGNARVDNFAGGAF